MFLKVFLITLFVSLYSRAATSISSSGFHTVSQLSGASEFLRSISFRPEPQLWSGTLKLVQDRAALQIGSQIYWLSFSNSEVIEQIRKLSPNDWVGAYAHLEDGVLHLVSVEFVGLRSLLGSWVASDQTIFLFKDFQNMQWGPRSEGMYTLLPTRSGAWTLIVSHSRGFKSAELETRRSQIVLSYPDDLGLTHRLVLVSRTK
ncbi:MAG: hypothetical protein WCH11_01725 [Bdellovibrio sp.]